ncbi:MAG: hypothetical protein AAFR73_02395 [Pseudomonadota bacterium]
MKQRQVYFQKGMDYGKFKRNCRNTLSRHFELLWSIRDRIETDKVVTFPTHLLFSNTENHFVFELTGSSTVYTGLQVKERKSVSVENLLCNFLPCKSTDHIFSMDSKQILLEGICMSWGGAERLCEERFPSLIGDRPRITRQEEGDGFISIASSSLICLKECVTLSKVGDALRCRNINVFAAFPKGQSKEEYINGWNWLFMDNRGTSFLGLSFLDSNKKDLYLMNEFKGLFLRPGLGETTITDFLSRHPHFLTGALGSDVILYEVQLPWLEKDETIEESSIRPDALVRRIDSDEYDIYDFKLPLLANKRLVTGKGRERIFLQYLEKGIAQLATYKHYFTFPKNRAFASREYGVSVAKPNLVLVVGHKENAIPQEVEVALRRYLSDAYSIIDYDSLCALFLNSRRDNAQ